MPVPRPKSLDLLPLTDLEQVQAERARRRLSAFLRQCWHVVEPSTPLVWGWHLDAICEHLEALAAGQIQNLIVTVPPGTTKSITASVVFPAWCWSRNPGLRFLTGSNTGDLSLRDAVAARRLIESDWYQSRWGDRVKMTGDQNVKSWYENTARGFRAAVSTGGAVTGRKGDVLILDDPNDANKVESELYRTEVNSWWDKAFYNRVNDHKTGCRLIVGQRLHHNDLIGHVLATSSEFVELRIPEEFRASRRTVTPLWSDPRTSEGELLRPQRFGPEQVEAAKRRLGPLGYAAQHGQEPELVEGGRFKSAWLRYYTKHGEYTVLGERIVDLRSYPKFITVDPAASDKKTSDYTVASVWTVSLQGEFIWLDCLRVQKEIPDIVPLLQQLCLKWSPRYVAIEAVAANRAVYQLACRATGPVIPARSVSPMGTDKLVRATPAITVASTGRLWLPGENARGSFPLEEVIYELTRFTGTPADDHDDIVDTLSYAVECEGTTPTGGVSRAKPMVLGG